MALLTKDELNEIAEDNELLPMQSLTDLLAHIREQDKALAQERETLDKLTAIAVQDTARLTEARELLTYYQHHYITHCACTYCERTAAWLRTDTPGGDAPRGAPTPGHSL